MQVFDLGQHGSRQLGWFWTLQQPEKVPLPGKGFLMNRRTFLGEAQWRRISPLLPGKVGDPGRSATDNRTFIEAVLYVARTGIPWRDLPKSFGAWNTVYKRFSRWSESGVWERVFAELSRDGHFFEVSLDSTIVRVHQHATGAQKKLDRKLLAALAAGSQQRSTP